MKRFCLLIAGLCCAFVTWAQYAPQAGLAGSTAIPASSSQFVAWATHCTVQRGYMDIANHSLGFASAGNDTNALGPANSWIVSLGDSGVAIVTFQKPLYNGPGFDFAIFENGFLNTGNDSEAFLELAFVEVSSDGVNYFRFPAVSLTDHTVQLGNSNYLNARKLNNFAGKYIGMYGTPFDLDELAGIAGLNVNSITHVRLIDVVGSVSGHSSLDHEDHIINEPYPTPFPSCGFDLDAVGVIHQVETGINTLGKDVWVSVYPNPAMENIVLSFNGFVPDKLTATLTNITGAVIEQVALTQPTQVMPVQQYPAGMYYLVIQDANGNKWVEKVTKY
ncbi:MAG: hypothetical protein K0Q79_2301 [Flavipsychrobacter sp.]|jgi:hypothetical protein|nr:hypothetical protein [Flavipsychrobacter sp.]